MLNTATTGTSQKTIRIALLLSFAALISGCDAVLDCLDKDGPVFNTTSIEPATLNQVYSQNIVVEVENEPFDDRFDYEFRLLSGTLPPGISATPAGRILVLSGTALELGEYNLEIYVEVDDGYSPADSNLCYRNRTREFQLIVQPDNS